jgi:hypothetical protein
MTEIVMTATDVFRYSPSTFAVTDQNAPVYVSEVTQQWLTRGEVTSLLASTPHKRMTV